MKEELLPGIAEFLDGERERVQSRGAEMHVRVAEKLKQQKDKSRNRRLKKIDNWKLKTRDIGQGKLDFGDFRRKVKDVFPRFVPPEEPYNKEELFGLNGKNLMTQAKNIDRLLDTLLIYRGMQVMMGRDIHFAKNDLRHVLQGMRKEEVIWSLLGAGMVRPADFMLDFGIPRTRHFYRTSGKDRGYRKALEKSLAGFLISLADLGRMSCSYVLGIKDEEKKPWDIKDMFSRMQRFERLRHEFLQRFDRYEAFRILGKGLARIDWREYWEMIEGEEPAYKVQQWWHEQVNFSRNKTIFFGNRSREVNAQQMWEEHPGKRYMKWVVYRLQRFCYGGDKTDWNFGNDKEFGIENRL